MGETSEASLTHVVVHHDPDRTDMEHISPATPGKCRYTEDRDAGVTIEGSVGHK